MICAPAQSFCVCLKITSTEKPPHWHGTDSSVSPRTLTSWERFVHHSLCLPLPPYVPLTADLLQGCGVEWVHHILLGGPQFVRFLSAWLLQAMIRGWWAQAGCPSWPGTGTSPATPICCRSHKLVESFVSCFALLPHLHFSGPHRHSLWLEANLTPCSSEKTDLRGFYSTGCIQEDNRKG